jgi:hypothetical protein
VVFCCSADLKCRRGDCAKSKKQKKAGKRLKMGEEGGGSSRSFAALHPANECKLLDDERDEENVLQRDQSGRAPYQLARNTRYRNAEVETLLLERQNEAVNAMKEAFVKTRLGLSQLVTPNVWSFAKQHLRALEEHEGRLYILNYVINKSYA